MTSVQVLDGLLDTATRDDLGRLHGIVTHQGDWYTWRKGRWTARVRYEHGEPQIPVDWLTPAGWIGRRSRSLYFEDGYAKPLGWTRTFVKQDGGWYSHDLIQSEGLEGPILPVPRLSYANNLQYYHNKNGTNHGPIENPPPPPDEWPETWWIPTT